MEIKAKIREIIEETLPLVDVDSDFLFSELDSLGVTTILMMLSEVYDIKLDSKDATPKNFMTIDSLATLVKSKMENRDENY